MSQKNFKGAVAIVTGGARGIGPCAVRRTGRPWRVRCDADIDTTAAQQLAAMLYGRAEAIALGCFQSPPMLNGS